MKDYLKCTNDNVQEYIDVIYSVMHDEDEIEKLRENSLSSENFREWKKLTHENRKLFQIIQLLKEYAIISSIE
tara:strand:- start:3500 stop:3718 length:219 start_codon:yes stop_codon:yes gene_type:complete